MFQRFQLWRKQDVTGVSGTGLVAEGCLFSNGKVVLTWLGKHPTVTTHESIESVEAIHCHGGLSVLVFLDLGDFYPRLPIAALNPLPADPFSETPYHSPKPQPQKKV